MPPQSRHRRPTPRHHSLASSALPSPPTPLDRRRWMDARSGISPEELAARENVRLDTITKSLDKMRAHAATHSQESVELATRELYLSQLPSAIHVFEDALTAMTMETKTIENPDTEETEIVYVEVPDHAMRLKAIESLKSLLAGVTPRTPMVQVDARTQINNAGQPHSHQGALSSESIIRQIRAERGLSLGTGEDIKKDVIVSQDIDRELEDEMIDDEVDGGEDQNIPEAEYAEED